MRVKKNDDGTFDVIEDRPMLLEGIAADQFVRDSALGDSTERRRFLKACDEAYQQSQAKRIAH